MPARTLVVCLLAGAILHGQEPDIRSIHRVTEEHCGLGDYAAARRTVTDALRARTGPVDMHRTGVLLRLLGRADYLLGDFEAAGRSYRAAHSSLERAGAAARVHLADTHLAASGRPDPSQCASLAPHRDGLTRHSELACNS